VIVIHRVNFNLVVIVVVVVVVVIIIIIIQDIVLFYLATRNSPLLLKPMFITMFIKSIVMWWVRGGRESRILTQKDIIRLNRWHSNKYGSTDSSSHLPKIGYFSVLSCYNCLYISSVINTVISFSGWYSWNISRRNDCSLYCSNWLYPHPHYSHKHFFILFPAV
jgi:hypothetical protein